MESFELRIEKIVSGGAGLGRHEGRVVFVPETIPGEVHRVEVVGSRKDYLTARSVACHTRSENRRRPPCPYFGSCGGCSLMHLTPEAQLDTKRSVLLECLERAGIAFAGSVSTRRSEETGYRNRARFHIAPAASGETSGRRMGFRRRESHDVVDVDRCLLGSDAMNRAWQELRQWIAQRPRETRRLVEVELQESSTAPGRMFARFFVSKGDGKWDRLMWRKAAEAMALEGLVVQTMGGSVHGRIGRPAVDHAVRGQSFRQSAGSFFQTNRFLLEPLVEAVLPAGEVARGVDLHCGVGLFALPLAARAREVVGVEASSRAVRDARANAEHAGLRNVRFVCEDVSDYAARAGFAPGDFVVADPPRGGLDARLVSKLDDSGLRKFVYVSCDPPSLARDAARLAASDFVLETLVLVDLFPNTHHFETVATFSRG